MIKAKEMEEPNLKCPACNYSAYSHCLGFRGTYCKPAICSRCNNIYDVNTEFCGEPAEVNKCVHCAEYDFKDWSQQKRPCPKCGVKMEVLGDYFGMDLEIEEESS